MIDLHCHLLPNIDDGPKNMEESLRMAGYAVSQGINQCVVTPHINPGSYDNDIETINTVYQSFMNELDKQGIPLKVGMAAEVRVCAELPQLIGRNKIPFLGTWDNRSVLLLEFPHDTVPVGVELLINWLMTRNITPLIAHPERNQAILRHPDKIMNFINLGCLLQITASSVSGLFGEATKQCALKFIEDGIVTIMASDAHNLHKRQPTMQSAITILSDVIGKEAAMRLVEDNPSKMLVGSSAEVKFR